MLSGIRLQPKWYVPTCYCYTIFQTEQKLLYLAKTDVLLIWNEIMKGWVFYISPRVCSSNDKWLEIIVISFNSGQVSAIARVGANTLPRCRWLVYLGLPYLCAYPCLLTSLCTEYWHTRVYSPVPTRVYSPPSALNTGIPVSTHPCLPVSVSTHLPLHWILAYPCLLTRAYPCLLTSLCTEYWHTRVYSPVPTRVYSPPSALNTGIPVSTHPCLPVSTHLPLHWILAYPCLLTRAYPCLLTSLCTEDWHTRVYSPVPTRVYSLPSALNTGIPVSTHPCLLTSLCTEYWHTRVCSPPSALNTGIPVSTHPCLPVSTHLPLHWILAHLYSFHPSDTVLNWVTLLPNWWLYTPVVT